MEDRFSIKKIIASLLDNMHEWKKLVLVLSCIVVFITTYILILPAFTLDKEEAAEQGGIDVPVSVESADADPDTQESAAAEEVQTEPQEDAKAEAAEEPEAESRAEVAEPAEEKTEKPAEAENVKESKEESGNESKRETGTETGNETAAPAPDSKASTDITLQNDEGDNVVVAVEGRNAGLSEDMSVAVREIDGNDRKQKKEYDSLYSGALEAVQEVHEDEGLEKPSDFEFAKFYDISLMNGKTEVEPDAAVDVRISFSKALQKELSVTDPDRVHIVHFAVDKQTGEVTPEVIGSDSTDITVKNNKVTEAAFTADSFSVFAVVYTVDFSYEIDGKRYEFSMNGEDSVSLRELIEALHVYEVKDVELSKEEAEEAKGSKPQLKENNAALDQFMEEVESVTFSNNDLLAVCKTEEDTTLGKLKRENGIIQDFSHWHPQNEVIKRNSVAYSAGDWVLISLKPFDSKEELTVVMKSGDSFIIDVTDAQDAAMNPDGTTVQTISNPAGTTIDLFDYWVDTDLRYNDGRTAWPGFSDGWNPSSEQLGGTGNESGINEGHALKFSPAWEHTVINGTNGTHNTNGANGLNSYTNGVNPFQGIVQDTLEGGYPKLTDNQTIGSNGESLAYLFDPSTQNNYRASYTGVNQLMYVDKDGYYTFDSRDYYARYNEGDKTFTVTEQTTNDSKLRGFWPFNDQSSGERNFWSGMHVNTQFSMPAGGRVLNPSNELKPMQFEFSGDDDVWIYVDGVLVGDAGGVHNRTEVDINFQTGIVTITGREPRYLDDLFRDAGKYNADDWNGHTFKDNTYHTFDFFYLERGGEESNLYIHYNLVSTADFTAHKSFHGTNEEDLLKRDQFKFELIGLDGKYHSVLKEETGKYELEPDAAGANARAIMPKGATTGGMGTVASPYYNGNTRTTVNGTEVNSQTYITGVTEDGNVNFGIADISAEDMLEADHGNAPVYRYVIREIVPDDAVNAEGKAWADADEDERAAGGFVKGDIIYDGTVYYMTGRVTSWTELGANGERVTKHGLSKTYYTDDTFTTEKEDTPFISFVNTYNAKHGNAEFVKLDQDKKVLPGATFALFRDEACQIPAKKIDVDNSPWTATSDTNGKVLFENVRVGTYYMKETEAPSGYAIDNTVYKIVIEDSNDSSKTSKITILGDASETPVDEIINAEEGKLTIEKKWLNSSGKEIAGGDHTADVNLYRKIDSSSLPQSTLVKVRFHREGATWDLDVGGEKTVLIVEDASSFEVTWHLGNDASHQLNNMKVNGVTYADAQDRTVDTGKGKITWTPWDGTTSRMVVSDISGELDIEFMSNCDWFSDKPKVSNKIPYVAPSADAEPEFVKKITLDSSNSWKMVQRLGGTLSQFESEGYDLPATDNNGYPYLYYVKELNAQGVEMETGDNKLDGFVLDGYSPNNSVGVSNQGVLTVYNRAEQEESINVVIKKTDDAPNSTNYLEGAVFKLRYRADSSGTYTKVSNEIVPELDSKSQFTVPEEGITLTGLVDGQYQLQEISPPEGYVIIDSEPVEFTVSGGEITGTDGTISGVRYTAATETSDAEFIIPNTPGAKLPSTGGSGTRIFTILGGALILAAGAAMLVRRRRRFI